MISITLANKAFLKIYYKINWFSQIMVNFFNFLIKDTQVFWKNSKYYDELILGTLNKLLNWDGIKNNSYHKDTTNLLKMCISFFNGKHSNVPTNVILKTFEDAQEVFYSNFDCSYNQKSNILFNDCKQKLMNILS